MGDAASMTLQWLHTHVRHSVGGPALQLPQAVATIVDATLQQWPDTTMADLARHKARGQRAALNAVGVIAAKAREVLELRCRTQQEMETVDLLVLAVVVEIAALWFRAAEYRIGIRRLCRQLRSKPAA